MERLFVADEIALEIIRRCDGVATVGAIVDELRAFQGISESIGCWERWGFSRAKKSDILYV